jgi:hypothetical protein
MRIVKQRTGRSIIRGSGCRFATTGTATCTSSQRRTTTSYRRCRQSTTRVVERDESRPYYFIFHSRSMHMLRFVNNCFDFARQLRLVVKVSIVRTERCHIRSQPPEAFRRRRRRRQRRHHPRRRHFHRRQLRFRTCFGLQFIWLSFSPYCVCRSRQQDTFESVYE